MYDDKLQSHNQNQKAYYSGAPRWRITPGNSPYINRHFDEMIDATGITSGNKVLEVGAGMGRFSVMFKQRGVDVVATDINADLLAHITSLDPEIETLACDALELPDRTNETFDQIIGFFILHHLLDLDLTFQRLIRLLKPGGSVAFAEPNAWYLPFYLQISLSPRMSWKSERGILNMRPAILFNSMKQAGFVSPRLHSYGFFPPEIANSGFGRNMEQLLESLPIPGGMKAFRIFTASKHG